MTVHKWRTWPKTNTMRPWKWLQWNSVTKARSKCWRYKCWKAGDVHVSRLFGFSDVIKSAAWRHLPTRPQWAHVSEASSVYHSPPTGRQSTKKRCKGHADWMDSNKYHCSSTSGPTKEAIPSLPGTPESSARSGLIASDAGVPRSVNRSISGDQSHWLQIRSWPSVNVIANNYYKHTS